MLKEHLKKHFKRIQTIKLKRHHYILGGFGIAAIIAIASIFGFQNINTHALDEHITCDMTFNKTGITVGERGIASLHCTSYYEDEPLPSPGSINLNAAFNYTPSIISLSIQEREEEQGETTRGYAYEKTYRIYYKGENEGTSVLQLKTNAQGFGNNAPAPFYAQTITVTGKDTTNPNCWIELNELNLIKGLSATGKVTCNDVNDALYSTGVEYDNNVLSITQRGTGNEIEIMEQQASTRGDETIDYEITFKYKGIGSGKTTISISGNVAEALKINNVESDEIRVIEANCYRTRPTTGTYININKTGKAVFTCLNISGEIKEANIVGYDSNTLNIIEFTGKEINSNTQIESEREMTPDRGNNIGTEYTIIYEATGLGTTHFTINAPLLGINNVQSKNITVLGNPTCSLTLSKTGILVNETGNGTLVCENFTKKLYDTYISYGEEISINQRESNVDGTNSTATFEYVGIKTGTTTIAINETGKNAIGIPSNIIIIPTTITINEEEPAIITVSCDFQAELETVNQGDGGEIKLTCGIEELPDFHDIRDTMTIIENNGNNVIETGTSRKAGRQELNSTTYILTFTGSNTGNVSIISNNSIALEYSGTKYRLTTKTPGQIKVDEAITPTGPDCTVTAEPASVTRGQGGTIIVQCTGEKVATGDIRNAIKTNEKVNVEEYPSEQTNIGDSNIKLVYQFTGAQVGTSYVLLLENRINSNGTRNGIVTGNDIEVVDTPTPTYCSIEAIPYSGYVNETGNIIVTCEGTKYYNLKNTGLDYSGNITVSYDSNQIENDNKTKFTFTYTGEIPGRSHLKLLENAIGNAQNGSTSASFDTGITVNNPIPDCNTGWDNDYFITPEFRALNPTPTQIACALYGSGDEDSTAYTIGRDSYKPGTSCKDYKDMTVIEIDEISSSTLMVPNAIYVLTSTGFERNNTIPLPSCSAIISRQTNGKDTTIKFNNGSTNGIEIREGYSIIDNISLEGTNNNEGINITTGENTLNTVKIYKRRYGMHIPTGNSNIINNIQVFGNDKGIVIATENNTIDNTQIYRNDIGVEFTDNAAYNKIYNVEIYKNLTGLYIKGKYNDVEDIELYYNDTNIYVLSGKRNNGYGNLQQYPATNFVEATGLTNDEKTLWKSEISGFNRIYSEADYETKYRFLCEYGYTEWYTYTGNNPTNFTGEAATRCDEEGKGEFLTGETNNSIVNTGWTNYRIIDEISMLTGDEPKYIGPKHRTNNMTNPKDDERYLNNWFSNDKGKGNTDKITDYSYGYEINRQKNVKLWNNNEGGLVTGNYFVGSNVTKFEIEGEYQKHTKVHYTLTGTSNGIEIKKYNIITQLNPNIGTTITGYIGASRTKFIGTNITNQLTGITINSGVDLYVKTGDSTPYTAIVQMYGEGIGGTEQHEREGYFAEHRYVGELSRRIPVLDVKPENMCVHDESITMTGTWTGYEYDMTGFDITDITVGDNATIIPDSFNKEGIGLYTWQVSLSGKTGKVIVESNTAEDILEFTNQQIFEKTYYRDTEAPEIGDNDFTANECKRRIINIDAQDYCARISGYKLEWNSGITPWQTGSIFRIEANTIGRTGGTTKTRTIHTIDNFGQESTKTISGTIVDIPPTIESGQTQADPYIYNEAINTDITISQSEIIAMLGAKEGECGTDDLSILSVSCDENAQGTLENGSINIHPLNNTDIVCSVVIKDNENSTKTGYIKFTASGITSTTHTCQWSTPDPQTIKIGQEGTIGLTCIGINFSTLTQTQKDNIISEISLSDSSKLNYNYTVGENTINITYTGAEFGTTKFIFNGITLDGTTTLGSAESYPIKVYNNIYNGCTRGEPTYNPIAVGVEAYIDLICEDFEYHAENAHELWSVILYSGDTNAIETGTAQWLSDSGEGSGVRFIYTGENVGKIQIKASGDSHGYLYLTDDYSSTIQIIDYENNRPTCTITGTEMVTVGQTGTITVDCINPYGILTTGITNDKLEHSGNIIVGDSIEEQPGTGQHKIFTFTFTGYIEGTGKIGLKTGAIKTVPGIENRYTEGNIITVVSGSNGTYICGWKDPYPGTLATGEAGYMELDCILDDRIPGFLIKSGDDNSLSQTLTLDNESGPRVLHYTGDNEGTTQYAISGNIGNVHIQTRRDDMGEENIRSKEIRVTNNGIILNLNPQNKISNQNITVNMSGENAEWVKYYKTGTAGLELDVCESRGTGLEQIGGQFNGTETISNNEEGTTYIYLCGKLGSDSLMKVGTYTIDTTKPECTLEKNPTGWTNSGVILSVSNITEINPKLYSWTGFEDMIDTTGTKIVYTTGDYNFYIKDAAGNTGMCSTGVYNIDTEGPTGEIEYINGNGGSGNSCTTGSVTIKLHTGESISGYPTAAFARNSTGNNAWTGNNTLTVTENGSGTGYIRDNAGNILALPYNVTGIVNEGPSEPILNSPENGNPISSSNTEFNWIGSTGDNCAEISGYTMHIISGTETIRTGSTNATNITPNTGLQNGTYSRYVIATDNFGQTAQSQTRTFTINSDMPTTCTVDNISYEPPYESGWTNTNVTGTLICTDTNIGILTGTNVFTGNGYLPFSFKDLSNGNIWIITGHVNRIDKQSPGCNINASAPSNGQVTLTLAFTGEEHQDLSGFSWDGTNYGDSYTTTVNTDGTYTGYVRDLAGNTGMCITTVNNVNTTKPTVYATNSSTTRKTGDIDITMHVTGINLSGAKYIMDNEVKSFNECKSEGTSYTNGTGITYSTEGTGYLTLCAYDNNGNTGYRTGIYKLDKSNPVCGTWEYDPEEITSGSVTATLAGSTDNISGIRTGGGSCTINEHNGTCNVTISDNAGNIKSCTSSGATNIDKQKPTGEIEITYPSGHLTNGCTSGNVILILSGSDVNGLHTYPYKRDNENWTTNPTKTLTNNAHGTGYIRDVAGNITAIPYNITGISHSGPSISLSRPDSGAILTGYVQFNWDTAITDPICQAISGGYNIVVYSGTVEQYTTNTNATSTETALPNGDYTWKVSITDILGHAIESEIRPFSINDQAPTCDIIYTPASGQWTSGTVTAILTGCSEGATGFNEIGHTFNENGTFTFQFTNGLGISGNKTANVRWIDKVPPYISGHTNTTTGWYTGDLQYSFIYNDTGAGIDGTNTISCTINTEGTGKTCSINDVNICDKAGNCNINPVVSQGINLDKSKPICGTWTYNPGSGTQTTGNVVVTLSGSYDTISQINVSTGSCTITGNNQNCNLTISDNAGNTQMCTSEKVTWIDKVAPVLHEVTPIGTTTDTTPNYTFSSTKSGTIAYSGACSSTTTGAVSGNNTITLNQLAYGTYSNCTITVTDAAGNTSNVLNISEFTIRSSGGGGGHGLKKDYCPDGDYSDSYYDRTCEGPIDICGVSTSKFNTEMKTAYLYAYQHGMTTICPIDDADLYGFIRRDQLAKMLTQYAINVLDLEPQAGKSGCTAYNDIANSSAEMKYYMKTACELDIMGLESDGKTPMKSFYPHGLVSRAEFGTTLSRLIYGDAYNLESEAENTYPGAWYGKHLEALKRDEIMTQIYGDRPQHLELRGYVMLMLMRHGKARLDNVKNIPYSTPEEIMDIYNKNKALTCETSYYESEDDYGSGMLYVKDNKLRENLKIHNEGNISSLIKNNKLYVRGDAIGSGMGMVADAEATALEELKALLEDDAYSFKNCNEAVKNINAFEIPSNIRFKSIGDWFTELANSFTSIFE